MPSPAVGKKYLAGQIGVPGQGPFMTIIVTLSGETIDAAKFRTYACPEASAYGEFVTTYSYNSANALTSLVPLVGSATTFSYDATGNLLGEHTGGALTTYTWDFENRMLSSAPGSGAPVTNTYSADGLRQAAIDSTGVTTFTWDNQNAYLINNQANGAQRYTGAPGDWGGLASQHSAATNTSLFYGFDLSGNATALVHASGQPVQNYFYSGFTALGSTSLANSKLGPPVQMRGMDEGMGGLKAIPAAEAYYNPLQLSAQYGLQDMGNGMNYARHRIVYKKLGRWPSMNTRTTFVLLLFLAVFFRGILAVAASTYNWTDPNPKELDSGTTFKDDQFEYELNGQLRFVMRRTHSGQAFIDVYRRHNLIFFVPDIEIKYADNDLMPGETDGLYAFYLAPDRRTMIVERDLFENSNFVYVYGERHGHMKLLGDGSARLDNLLIKEFMIKFKMQRPQSLEGTRNFELIRWFGNDKVLYLMTACNWWCGHDTPTTSSANYCWYGVLDLRTLKTTEFHRVKTPDYYKLYLHDTSSTGG